MVYHRIIVEPPSPPLVFSRQNHRHRPIAGPPSCAALSRYRYRGRRSWRATIFYRYRGFARARGTDYRTPPNYRTLQRLSRHRGWRQTWRCRRQRCSGTQRTTCQPPRVPLSLTRTVVSPRTGCVTLWSSSVHHRPTLSALMRCSALARPSLLHLSRLLLPVTTPMPQAASWVTPTLSSVCGLQMSHNAMRSSRASDWLLLHRQARLPERGVIWKPGLPMQVHHT